MSFVEREIVEKKWEPAPNLIRENGEEDRETTENILAP